MTSGTPRKGVEDRLLDTLEEIESPAAFIGAALGLGMWLALFLLVPLPPGLILISFAVAILLGVQGGAIFEEWRARREERQRRPFVRIIWATRLLRLYEDASTLSAFDPGAGRSLQTAMRSLWYRYESGTIGSTAFDDAMLAIEEAVTSAQASALPSRPAQARQIPSSVRTDPFYRDIASVVEKSSTPKSVRRAEEPREIES